MARQGVDFVLKGNIIAARFALLCLVAIVLKAHHVVSWLSITQILLNLVSTQAMALLEVGFEVEQPSSSKLVFYPYMQFIWRNYGAIFQRLSLVL